MEMIGAAAGEGVRARKVVSSLETRVSAVERLLPVCPSRRGLLRCGDME